MRKLQLPLTESDIDTREKRRRAVSVIEDEVFRIRIAEERYMNLIPENLRSGYPYLYARRVRGGAPGSNQWTANAVLSFWSYQASRNRHGS